MKDEYKILMCDARQRKQLKYKTTFDNNKEKHFTR